MKLIQGGVTAPKGFLASGIYCGIKYSRKDLALIYSKRPAVACGVFTQNRVVGAPVTVTQAHLKNSRAQAVVVNSGNANCCTGIDGIKDAQAIAQAVAENLGISSNDVLVASTGTIGKRLPVLKIKNKVGLLTKTLGSHRSLAAAQAIMTTDTRAKQIALKLRIGGAEVRIGGIAKGAGMIAPNMATMLGFITTDAAVDKVNLKKALKEAVDNSFNLITVEGDTSTNDMVLVLANGLAGNKKFGPGGLKAFQETLNFVCLSLAKMIVQDAEGATKFVEVKVEKARDVAQAKRVAFKVANSPLVKTAVFGENPNWGRIAAAAGGADNYIQQNKLDIYLGALKVMQKGARANISRKRLAKVFKKREIQIRIELGLGKAAATVFTCDISHDYLKINAEY